MTRRQWLAAGAATLALPRTGRAAPTAPVAVARCNSYGRELTPVLRRMFDQLGGLGGMVRGKTVGVKVNMTGTPTQRVRYVPAENSYWTHPALIGSLVHLLGEAGARRVLILEGFAAGAEPLEEEMLAAGWEPRDILNAAPRVEMENTGFLGYGKRYARLMVNGKGYIYPGFDLNHSYADCDFFISLAKLKEHATAGVTLSMKNLFGIAPPTIYGDGAGEMDPAPVPHGGRQMFHSGYRQPSRSAPPEIDPASSRESGYRVPRIVVDLVASRPIDLALIDGIETMTGGEGPWLANMQARSLRIISPGILVAGRNPVTTDAVSMKLMGFNSMATRGAPPFEHCDSTLALAEAKGLGTRDPRRIEVIGPPLDDLTVNFRAVSG